MPYHTGMVLAGAMSGTSCDGTSVALIETRGARVRLLGWATHRYARRDRERLLRLASGFPAAAAEVARAADFVADAAARAVAALARRAGVPLRHIAAVGVHGHTLYHGPRDPGGAVTFQAGNWSRIAEALGVAVVGDFRARDIAAGGEGAPLAPWAHARLFGRRGAPRLILNLGGIANVTWLPGGRGDAGVRAFDTGPANVLLDLLAARATRGRAALDAGGRIAARGRPDETALRRLLAHPYFRRPPPKSTGRETFGASLLPRFRRLRAADALATAVAFTARSVADQIAHWLPPAARWAPVYAAGGGARNPVLMRALAASLAPRPVHRIEALGWPERAVEPACFALLAGARLRGEPNTLPAATGAHHAVSAGVIAPA
jgi:anhydro-N-acetylmuramic acid kinase